MFFPVYFCCLFYLFVWLILAPAAHLSAYFLLSLPLDLLKLCHNVVGWLTWRHFPTATVFGYSYNRWKDIVNAIISNEAGNFKICHLRVLHIYKANYNAILGMHWRGAMHFAVDRNWLHPGQFGGCPDCTTHEPVLIE